MTDDAIGFYLLSIVLFTIGITMGYLFKAGDHDDD